MILYPAIDLLGGKAVRLYKGDYAQVTVYDEQPERAAAAFFAAGAEYLHVVDLDGARDGSAANVETVKALTATGSMKVQVGGGIRDIARVQAMLELGVFRVILGTAALKEPEFLRETVRLFGDKIAVGVDARDGMVAVKGWREQTAVAAFDFCRELADSGVKTVIFTDISRDGTLTGPNVDAYRTLCRIDGLAVIASGGVSSLDDLVELKRIGAAGAILGKALYEHKLDLAEGLKRMKGDGQ